MKREDILLIGSVQHAKALRFWVRNDCPQSVLFGSCALSGYEDVPQDTQKTDVARLLVDEALVHHCSTIRPIWVGHSPSHRLSQSKLSSRSVGFTLRTASTFFSSNSPSIQMAPGSIFLSLAIDFLLEEGTETSLSSSRQ